MYWFLLYQMDDARQTFHSYYRTEIRLEIMQEEQHHSKEKTTLQYLSHGRINTCTQDRSRNYKQLLFLLDCYLNKTLCNVTGLIGSPAHVIIINAWFKNSLALTDVPTDLPRYLSEVTTDLPRYLYEVTYMYTVLTHSTDVYIYFHHSFFI